MKRVLVADDEENIRLVLTTVLKKAGYEVEAVASAEEALARVSTFDPDFVLADVRMGGMTGIELCTALRARGQDATVIIMSAYGSLELALDAMKAGAYDYVAKPFKRDEVLLALRKAEERETLRRENKALREAIREQQSFATMLGKSEAMRRVFRVVEKVAGYDTTVLIQGESGTGKELIARALHDMGGQRAGRFVPVNCGAIPGTLLETELFGHKKGAFTDARADKRGLFEEADGGTLFLDEIGELPLALQVKLLRVLQEGTIRPVGDVRDKEVKVRVVAATVRDLEHEVKEGRFREDLFYRLNVLQIVAPPLRERAEDVLLLGRALHRPLQHPAGYGRARARRCCQEAPGAVSLSWERARAREPDRARRGAHGGPALDRGRPTRPRARAHRRCRGHARQRGALHQEDAALHRGVAHPQGPREDPGQPHAGLEAARDQPPRAALQDQGLRAGLTGATRAAPAPCAHMPERIKYRALSVSHSSTMRLSSTLWRHWFSPRWSAISQLAV
jgi:two-component system response regulator AtoC